jgi:hypothetical protein
LNELKKAARLGRFFCATMNLEYRKKKQRIQDIQNEDVKHINHWGQ